MPYKVTKEQAQAMAHKPDISGEYKEKIAELTRRLGANGFNYERDWDTMAFTAQQAFIEGLFLDGLAATSVDDYVESAAQSCGCPDVVEDLHWHSPALMGEIEKVNQPAEARYISEGVAALNKMIEVASIAHRSAKTPDRVLDEASSAVQGYEQRVIDSLNAAGIIGSMEVAHADATGPDAEFVVNGNPYFLEIKLNSNAQMGDTAVRYYPARSQDRFELAKPAALDEEAQTIVFAALDRKEQDILNWVEALRDPARPASEKWVDNAEKSALGFQTTYRRYQDAKASGLLLKAGAGYGKATPITAPANIIKKLYASKNVYYIQIGGKGLYYLESNPANLPIPPFDGEINIELRPRPSGRTKTTEVNPETGEKVVTGYKVWQSAVPGDENVVHYGGSYSVTPRFVSKDLKPSPFSMDDPASIEAMLGIDRSEEESAPQEEAKATAQELETDLDSAGDAGSK